MVDVRGDVLRPPPCTTPAAVKANKNKKMCSFKSNENNYKKQDGSYYVVSANKASSVTCNDQATNVFNIYMKIQTVFKLQSGHDFETDRRLWQNQYVSRPGET